MHVLLILALIYYGYCTTVINLILHWLKIGMSRFLLKWHNLQYDHLIMLISNKWNIWPLNSFLNYITIELCSLRHNWIVFTFAVYHLCDFQLIWTWWTVDCMSSCFFSNLDKCWINYINCNYWTRCIKKMGFCHVLL